MLDTTGIMTIRKPRVLDVPEIKRLIDSAASDDALLPRTLIELYENIRDFHIYVDEHGVGGCCALHVDMASLAEVRSLVVREDLRRHGIGTRLVDACIDEARQLGTRQVYALTRVPGFFERNGFRRIDKHNLPSKVFRDCVRCSKFPDCDEIALVYDVEVADPETTGATVSTQE